jgi:hypothetical protein
MQAEGVFEQLDLLAHCTGGDAKPLRRFRHAAAPAYRFEHLQRAQRGKAVRRHRMGGGRFDDLETLNEQPEFDICSFMFWLFILTASENDTTEAAQCF